MSVAGRYECTTKTPMGTQKGVLTIVPEGDTFTGTIAGDLGAMDLENGTIAGNTIAWKMTMTSPMKIDLDCKASIEGDDLTGTIKAGFFGTMELKGTRIG
ncbi:hypothetical protein [Novosphingobium mangrovi (ex Hu et al. 2023)]|uniref:Uncharacterized protein n=1 Tax=Novosphingobium mangrovi (ex Hu et al. 2023) TaxID=2930094 RepID=A0ABT0AH30_9SPHN|nr:hypothetical protein [Novosphingobium mangrovi (ex Hu et al. 2023)]MCJ1962494.1 hypothetical protein [Novosphingobium mangrovi (ex Hu et al. 2023)]MED5546219.1 hypothetical protein [Pseudomonadota bacterium]